MTDYQFRKLLRMVLEILKGCEDLNQAIEKLKELSENDED